MKKTTFLAGGMLILIAALILIEYSFNINLHIDQIFIKDYMHTDTLYPGRPAPNTAIVFMLIGCAEVFLAINYYKPSYIRTALIDIIGFIVFALGSQVLGGYMQSVEKAYTWGTDTRMSIHTSVASTALGIGLLSLSWQINRKKISEFPLWVPAIVCFLALQIDLAMPSHILVSIVYIPLIFCSLWFKNLNTIFIFATIASILIIMRYFMLPIEFMTWDILVNRLLMIGTTWLVASLVYKQLNIDRKHQRNEKYLRAIVDHTVDGLIVINTHGIIINFNKASEQLFGYTEQEVAGQNINMLMPPSYSKHHDQYLKNYLTTGQERIIGIGREVEGQRKNGTVFPMDLSVSEMNVNGQRFFSGIVRDITARKLAEQELLQSNTELERFVFIAAHDLQEPLRTITMYSDMLEEDYSHELDKTAIKYIKSARSAAIRMRTLIKDLLEYSRMGNEKQKYETISIEKTIQMALDNLKKIIETKKAEITVSKHLPDVVGNNIQLVSLYQNLIENALKYTHGMHNPKINLTAERSGEHWVFSVQDHGIGIEEKYLEQIFVPFKRLHTAQEYSGTGIGLSMCKRIVEQHGGRLWATSKLNQGSTFSFTLPTK